MTDAELLKDTRQKLGLTQQEFADRWWNGDQKSVSRVEIGNSGLTKITRKYVEYIREKEGL